MKSDKCLMNTSIVDLNNVVGKQLGSSMNVVIEGFQNYITAIKDKKKDEDNTNIDNAKNVLDARINGYETNTVPNAKTQMDNKCQDDNNESDCIRTARKEFNKYKKPIKLEGVNCFIYRSAHKNLDRKYEQLTPRNPQDATSGLSNFVNLTDAIRYIKEGSEPKGYVYKINAGILNTKNPLKAVFDGWGPYKTGHVAIIPTINGTATKDPQLLLDWAITRTNTNNLYKLPNNVWVQKALHPFTGYVYDSVILDLKVE